ncbi:CUE domain-containing protein 2 isoform X2 [Euwallacea fornicatus]|uniref:CUE domain-containing protein 2 isoform X2 n=1 Tax=Euwallacea fornicatus TaxID=995702 RepID=UPI00338DCA72
MFGWVLFGLGLSGFELVLLSFSIDFQRNLLQFVNKKVREKGIFVSGLFDSQLLLACVAKGTQIRMSTKMIADQESTIKDSLFEFVRYHISDADLTLIDDIVLSYVIAFLEDVGSDSQFDVDGFCEMMEAYFPKFGTINQSLVCQWMFDLEEKLRKNEGGAEVKSSGLEIILPEVVSNKPKPRSHSNSESVETPKRVHKLSEMSDGGSTDSSCCDFPDEMDILQEMFPSVCAIEVKQCLAIAAGDIERATQILIDRQENGQCLSQNTTLTMQVAKQTIDDAELKNRIIERYSYIDKDTLNKLENIVSPPLILNRNIVLWHPKWNPRNWSVTAIIKS